MLNRHIIILFVLIFTTGCSSKTALNNPIEAKTALIQKISLATPKGKVNSAQVVFSPDSTMVAAIVNVNQKKSHVMIWGTQNGKLLHSTELINMTSMWSEPMRFTPDSKKLFYSTVNTGRSFIWHFTKNKKPIFCFTGSTVVSLTSEHVLVDPTDYVVGLFSLKDCSTVALGVDNRARAGRTILTADNKILWTPSIKLSKAYEDEWLYNKDPNFKMYHSKRFKGKTDLLVLPTLFPEKKKSSLWDNSGRVIFNTKKEELIQKRTYADKNLVALSLWDYSKKKMLWRKNYITGTLFEVSGAYDSYPDRIYYINKFDLDRSYIIDKQSIRVIDLKTGDTLKTITFPRNSLKEILGGYVSNKSKFFLTSDTTKLFITTDSQTKVFNMQTGKTIQTLNTQELIKLLPKQIADNTKKNAYDPCSKNLWKCLFNHRNSISEDGKYIAYGKDEHTAVVVDITTKEVLIKAPTFTRSNFSKDTKGNTLIVTSKNDHELVLWRLK